MIYDADRWGIPRGGAPAAGLAAKIAASCGSHVLGSAEHLEELAKAVDSFLRQEGNGAYVDSDCLIMLAAQALEGLGEPGAARKLVVLGTGLASPSEWTVTGEDAVWVLDLNRITVRADAMLEMVFFSMLHMVVESMADVWDGTGGKGTMGLRHVCATAAALLGKGGRGSAGGSLEDEIRGTCQDKLGQIGTRRGWEYVPRVMNLDV